jgi:hypothetical protein
MSSIDISLGGASPLDKEFLQYNLESKTVPRILQYLSANDLKSISNDTKIIKYDLNKFTPFSNFRVVKKSETDNKYTFLIHSGNHYKIMDIYKISKHINPELEAFTLEYKLANNYKRQHTYSLILAQKTNYDIDENEYRAELKDKIKKYTDDETALQTKKKELENKWIAEIKAYYDEKSALVNLNKDLYQRRLEVSNRYYSLPLEQKVKEKAQFMNEYRIILAQSTKNQERILEINKTVEILETKASLYISETFLYNPRSVLTITTVSKGDYDSMLGLSGGSYIEDEYSSVTKELSGLNNKKEYRLEYLDIDDLEELESIASYYKEVKDKIKKLSKKHIKLHKSVINKDLMRELEVL